MREQYLKDELRAEYARIYDGNYPKWIDSHIRNIATVAVLPSGEFVPINKEHIKTRFCYGESGYDADEAWDMAHTAKTNETYFKMKNMEHYDEIIGKLKEDELNHGDLWLVFGQDGKGKLLLAKFMRLTDIIQAFGEECFLEQLPGKEFVNSWNATFRIATAEEKKCVLEAYERARAMHEKKVDAYLKRYGLSKVESWTYWRDA